MLDLYHNQYVKWEFEGKEYVLHVMQDNDPWDHPRGWGCNLGIMACWHRRYDLGDKIEDATPEGFWRRLVRENVPEIEDYDLEIRECQALLEPYTEWMPLWLYDHSGITMPCGERTYPYTDRWDSSQVGWIVATKSRAKELWGSGFDETAWRKRAIEEMRNEVTIYDQFLTGEVYGFNLMAREDEEWEDIDSCWSFFGYDITESGMADTVGHGLTAAIKSGAYKKGEARSIVTRHWEYA